MDVENQKKLKILFFGLGSIGKRHAILIKDNFNFELYAYRTGKSLEKNDLGIKEFYNLDEAFSIKPDVAFITNPTFLHISTAIECAKRNIPLFIEKPLSNNKKNLSELLKIVNKSNLVTYIAYCLRFHPAIIWLKKYLKENTPLHVSVYNSSYLPNWRENVNHLKHYNSFKDKGGGVILELSHDIDYLYYLFGDIKKMSVNSSKISNVTVDSEDFVDILLHFKNNLFGNIHINFLSRLLRIEVIVNFKDSTIIADIVKSSITIIKDKKQETIDFNIERDDYFLSQLKYFFDNLEKGKMINDFKESLKVFNIIMQIKKEAQLN